jgi:DNA repair exonuclease SbcCD ATPase subunit
VLLKNSKISRSNIYWIDEGFGVLDDTSLSSVKDLFEQLRQFFKKIIMITHIDQLKDIVNYSLIITKTSSGSKIS